MTILVLHYIFKLKIDNVILLKDVVYDHTMKIDQHQWNCKWCKKNQWNCKKIWL